MAWYVIAGYAIYGALAFGWRSWLQYQHTGSTGFRGLSGSIGSIEWVGGALFVVAIVCAVLAPILDLTGAAAKWDALDSPPAHVAGGILYVIGVVGTLWSQLSMGASWRIGVDASERTRLIIGGPFVYVRNPIYTSMIVAFIGLALVLPNAAAIAAVVVLIGAVEIHVRYVEEPYLLSTHGEAYRRYCRVAGRFVPWPHRVHLSPASRH